MDYNVKFCYTAFLKFQNTVEIRNGGWLNYPSMKILYGRSLGRRGWSVIYSFRELSGLYQFIFKYAVGRY